ncbi:MAG: diguanylate cyclase [Deltaproteobacteria bacterium]|nr:diguanylate cyclase [Candidatus Anaeroferrophillacea bacterium]
MDIELIRQYRELCRFLLKGMRDSYSGTETGGRVVTSLLDAFERINSASQVKDLHRQLKDVVLREPPARVDELQDQLAVLKREVLRHSDDERQQTEVFEGLKGMVDILLREVGALADQDENLQRLYAEVRENLDRLATGEEAAELQQQLKNLLFHKAMIQGVLDQERDELKNIIVIMAGTLTAFVDVGGSFSSNLDDYAKRLQVVRDLQEIQTVRDLLLKETISLKDHTARMMQEANDANVRVEMANQKIEKLKQQMERIKQEVILDPLTRAYNRRAFDERINQELSAAKRYGNTSSLIMLDIDHFKDVNDSYGHRTGDGVLRVVAGILKKEIRDIDVLCRYGGEEFTLILPHTPLHAAADVAERLRRKIAESRFSYKGRHFHVTASFGVGEISPADTVERCVRRADEAMYRAKEGGRNCVRVGAAVLAPESP